jgi:hypothetical protein
LEFQIILIYGGELYINGLHQLQFSRKEAVLGHLITPIALVLVFSFLASDQPGSLVIQSSAQENKNSNVSNPFENNVQTWTDNESGIKIQFSRSPIFPFVGNVTQLNFRVTGSNSVEPVELTHVHVTLIKNVTTNINNDQSITNRNDFITFDNITSTHGTFSLKYRFLEEGEHQILVKINTEDDRVALGSFHIPVIKFWWNLF